MSHIPKNTSSKSLLDRWADCLYDGHLMRTMQPMKYCKMRWKEQGPETVGKTKKVFMESCLFDVAAYKAYLLHEGRN